MPVLRSRGLAALPVTYIGKAATFALMSAFPLILLGRWLEARAKGRAKKVADLEEKIRTQEAWLAQARTSLSDFA